MKATMIVVNIVAAILLFLAPEVAINIHDVHSLSVYRGLVHKGLVHENSGTNETERLQQRQQEDAFVEQLREIGGVKYYYRLLCWASSALLSINAIVQWRKS
jgi:hypothetical protein